jgi:hypothetical protein
MDINMFTSAINNKQVHMDKKLLEKIQRIMRYNLGHKLDMNAPNLRAHVDGILRENLFRKFRKAVPNFSYLEGREWFCKNPQLQHQLLQVVNKGLGQHVDATAGDFALHLDCLFYRDMPNKDKLYEKYITNSWYTGRFHLYNNPTLDQMLYDAIKAGLGPLIDVGAASIRVHLDCLLHKDDHFYLFRKYVSGFKYLEKQTWFTESKELQEKLFLVVKSDFGQLVNPKASDFNRELDYILKLAGHY